MPSNENGAMKPSSRDFYFDAAVSGMVGVAELSWYGIDGDGCIAVLSTAGRGMIPKAAVSSKAIYFHVDDFFSELEPYSAAEIVRHEGDVSTWEEEAQCGLYSFDYDQGRGDHYWLIARPTEPRKISSLPSDIQQYLRDLQVIEGCFRTILTLRPQDRLDVVERTHPR